MIYTCYDMVRDCRADRPEGWRYFITNYIPAIRKLVAHYGGEDHALIERVVRAVRKPESSMFASLEPAPERWFLAELRQKVLGELPEPAPEIELGLETAAEAFAPLTVVEKQAVWIEGMGYSPEETGAMLRMAPATVAKIRDRAAELLRGQLDSWRRSLLRENGRRLGKLAAAARGPECPSAKAFLDILDGRTTWSGREQVERHVTGCLHCIDHFCRMAEVIELLRQVKPLAAEESQRWGTVLGIEMEKKKRGWF